MTFNIGMTHNIGGKSNRRFKANLGTGYTEPGMGELYYNWEMYAGHPVDSGVARMGYYFIGNKYLKPEKSVNIDIGYEMEEGRTAIRVSAFHNRIRNYMTTFFTGRLLDFFPANTDEEKSLKWLLPPDMIYSFKNIGRAEITGLEAEVDRRFDSHWSGKLGYTLLHAINKSDPLMPRRLLDRPQHKLDIGISYENRGWRASLWGSYYIKMLDSNTVANNGNYLTYDEHDNIKYNFAEGGKQTYETKTFGIWNLMVQKDLGKGSSAYVGIDNILNHRDDDRALQQRVYRIGVNLTFGPDADTEIRAKTAEEKPWTLPKDRWFIVKPFETEKERGVRVIGDYRARWNVFTGKIKPSEARVTRQAQVGTAYKNYLEKAEHGFEQRLRAGVDARIGNNTNVRVLGGAAGNAGVDTEVDASKNHGLSRARIDEADVTQHVGKWDLSLGRLTEPMGVTGYYFGKEYDGARAVWTGRATQVRLGYTARSATVRASMTRHIRTRRGRPSCAPRRSMNGWALPMGASFILSRGTTASTSAC